MNKNLQVTKHTCSLEKHILNWKQLTSNKNVIRWIKGIDIQFQSRPEQLYPPYVVINNSDLEIYKETIKKLLSTGAISECKNIKTQFLSSYFLAQKSNGTYRFILNLKQLNEHIEAPHFKLEDYRTVLKLVSQSCYFTSIDLKDAYFSFSIKSKFRKYLRFIFEGKTYQFNCLPFGLNIAPYIFTKVIRPVLTYLRKQNIICTAYLDDFLVIGKTRKECQKHIYIVKNILTNLGFTLNLEKSELVPKQNIIFLGFQINSYEMSFSLPKKRKDSIVGKLQILKNKQRCCIRDFARLIGTLVAACPAVKYGWFHIKLFEHEKFKALSSNHNNYSKKFVIPNYLQSEFNWWIQHIPNSKQTIIKKPFLLEIFSDASKTGWGGNCGTEKTNGFWEENEKKYHINYLELLAAYNALRSFAKEIKNGNILLRIDNTTAIACINKMGSVQYDTLNKISQKIWRWCEKRKNFVFASYISSSKNTVADSESRAKASRNEYQLSNISFQEIIKVFGRPNIDLFATYLNKKCTKFISWKPDPESFCVDAFTVPWNKEYFYAFPPFCLVSKVLEKIIQEKAVGIVIVPDWPSQSWFPLFIKLLLEKPLKFSYKEDIILSPFRELDPLLRRTSLVAGKLYGGLLR